MSVERLDKLVSLNCGVSRRDARKLIKEGKVSVNGELALKAETAIDPEKDGIAVEGYRFTLREHVYIMLNKPEGVISASADPKKKTVVDLVPDDLRRRSLFPAGRLDRDTTGLLIITDDGDFTHRLLSPTHHVFKTYIARLDCPMAEEKAQLLRSGITLEDGTACLPAFVRTYTENGSPFAEIRIREGKYHQVKKMCAACGCHVEALRRVAIGALRLDENLAPGECRECTDEELALLFAETAQPEERTE